jgi:hypothetical protein
MLHQESEADPVVMLKRSARSRVVGPDASSTFALALTHTPGAALLHPSRSYYSHVCRMYTPLRFRLCAAAAICTSSRRAAHPSNPQTGCAVIH